MTCSSSQKELIYPLNRDTNSLVSLSVLSVIFLFPPRYKWMAENIDGSVYHMVRTGVVPAVSVGPQLTRRDAAMLFLETTQTTRRKKGEKGNSGTISQNVNSFTEKNLRKSLS